jgi:hypothetical protein
LPTDDELIAAIKVIFFYMRYALYFVMVIFNGAFLLRFRLLILIAPQEIKLADAEIGLRRYTISGRACT